MSVLLLYNQGGPSSLTVKLYNLARMLTNTQGQGTVSLTAAAADFQSQIQAPSALTETDDTNVTLTLGGSPSTALVAAVSITVGWTGTLALSRLAQGSAGQIIVGQTSAAPSYETVSGDATLAATGALTLATVNSGSGSVGSSTAIPVLTTNAKGLVTAQTTAVVI